MIKQVATFFNLLLAFQSVSLGGPRCSKIFSEMEAVRPAIFGNNRILKFKFTSNFNKIAMNLQSYPGEITWENGLKTVGIVKSFGDSSLEDAEAPFRKLKITSLDEKGKTFDLYVNTHLHNNPTEKWTPQGRITDGTSPYREALVYDLAAVLKVTIGAYRRAAIQYHNADTGKVFTKPALILEDFKDTAERNNGKLVSEDEFYLQRDAKKYGEPNVIVPEAVRAQLLQILIGNTDYKLEINNVKAFPTVHYQPLKNVILFRDKGSGEMHPIIYDFDVASIVVGHEITAASKPWEQIPEITSDPVTMVMLRKLLHLRSLVKINDLKNEIEFIKENHTALIKIVSAANVDKVGRDLAMNHIQHFFEAVEMMWLHKFQFMLSKGIAFYESPRKQINLLKDNWIEDVPGTIRQGTPFVILGEEGGFLKILLIDTAWDLVDYNKRIGYISKQALYSNELPADQIPFFDSRSMHQ